MPTRTSHAIWEGDLKGGKGTLQAGNGNMKGSYSFPSRFEEGEGTNPEELIGAAHAGCFSMALSLELTKAGFKPERIDSSATVHLDKQDGGFKITRIELATNVKAEGLDKQDILDTLAESAKQGCPVSQALTGVDISVTAKLRE